MREGTKLRERFPSRTHNDCSGRARRMTAGYVPFAIHALPRSDQIRSGRHEIALRSRSHRDLPCCRKGLWLRSSQCPANARPIPMPTAMQILTPMPGRFPRRLHVSTCACACFLCGCVGAWVCGCVLGCVCARVFCVHVHTRTRTRRLQAF